MSPIVIHVVPVPHLRVAVVSNQSHVLLGIARFPVLPLVAGVRRITKLYISRLIFTRERRRSFVINVYRSETY